MLLIMCTGGPVTGRSTTAKTLQEYFTSIDVESQICGKTESKYSLDSVKLDVYRWINQGSPEVMIIDGNSGSYFDRKEILDSVDDVAKMNNVEYNVIAINHERSEKFMFAHNKDKGHHAYTEKRMYSLMRLVQQPIREENIDLIFRVKHNHNVDMHNLIALINKYIGTKYPVPEAEVDTSADMDETSVECTEETVE